MDKTSARAEIFEKRLAWLVSAGITVHQNHDELYAAWQAVQQMRPERFMEIGSMEGGSLYMYAGACAANAQIISLDVGKRQPHWRHLQTVTAKLGQEGFKIDVIRGNSRDAALFAKIRRQYISLDVLHIDGAHDYGTVKSDYERYGSMVRLGGIILFHDTQNLVGPMQLMCELRAEQKLITEWAYDSQPASSSDDRRIDQMRNGIRARIGIAMVRCMTKTPVAICVIPWDSSKWTRRFIDNIRRNTAHPYKIYISDNSEAPDVQTGSELIYWWNGENVGFSRALNRCLKISSEQYLVICNTDIDLPRGWLTTLRLGYDQDEFDVIAPAMNDGPPIQRKPGRGIVATNDAPTFAMWFLRRSIIDIVGYPREDVDGVHCTDLEMAWRIWQAGGAFGIDREVYVVHHKSSITSTHIERDEYKKRVKASMAKLKKWYGPEFGGRRPKQCA